MARASWINDDHHPDLDAHVGALEHFTASLAEIRADPLARLWGDRLMITRGRERRVVGSVVFHGKPDAEGTTEVAYGVEEGLQGQGYATEGTRASAPLEHDDRDLAVGSGAHSSPS